MYVLMTFSASIFLNFKLEPTMTSSPRRQSRGLHNPYSSHDQIQCFWLAEVWNFTTIMIEYNTPLHLTYPPTPSPGPPPTPTSVCPVLLAPCPPYNPPALNSPDSPIYLSQTTPPTLDRCWFSTRKHRSPTPTTELHPSHTNPSICI